MTLVRFKRTTAVAGFPRYNSEEVADFPPATAEALVLSGDGEYEHPEAPVPDALTPPEPEPEAAPDKRKHR